MFKKLDKMLERFNKLTELTADADVIAHMDEWKAYTKELADMSETVEKYKSIQKGAFRAGRRESHARNRNR